MGIGDLSCAAVDFGLSIVSLLKSSMRTVAAVAVEDAAVSMEEDDDGVGEFATPVEDEDNDGSAVLLSTGDTCDDLSASFCRNGVEIHS